MKFFSILIFGMFYLVTLNTLATDSNTIDVRGVISEEEFSLYKDVGEFIQHSPKITIIVKPEQSDVAKYGEGVVKTLTGSDCDRDGKMDDNPTCNATYLKLWLKYKR